LPTELKGSHREGAATHDGGIEETLMSERDRGNEQCAGCGASYAATICFNGKVSVIFFLDQNIVAGWTFFY
jgi:hypothetical protein